MASAENAKLVQLLRENRPPAVPYEVMKNQVDKMRENFVAANRGFKVRSDTAIDPVDAGGVPGAWFTPAAASADYVLLYLHGGGHVMGSVQTHRSLIDDLAHGLGGRALGLDYRLAPEHPFPAGLEDATAAYRWLLKSGYGARQIVLAGDSAGGGLAAATLVALRDAGDPLPAGAALLSPWTDLEGTGPSCQTRAELDPMVTPMGLRAMARLYVGEAGNLRDPLASPLLAKLHGLPPLLVQAGDWEILRDDAVRFAEAVHRAGGSVRCSIWPEMVHVFPFFTSFIPEAREGVAEIVAFLRDCLGAA
jgi:monoterpene epsilon-lactone hydrolase